MYLPINHQCIILNTNIFINIFINIVPGIIIQINDCGTIKQEKGKYNSTTGIQATDHLISTQAQHLVFLQEGQICIPLSIITI